MVGIAFVLLRGGLFEPSAPAKAAKELVGQWVVVSINGQKIPAETIMTIDYKTDGRLFIREIGGDGFLSLPSAPKLKEAFDQLEWADRRRVEVTIRAEGSQIELRRKPETPVPAS
jgi:hypothetical protein